MVIDKDAPKYFSTFEAAKMLGVDMTTVIDWCKQGKLAAFKTPGGHRRIQAADLVSFLRTFKMPIPAALAHVGVLKVVVVDDEEPIRRAVTRILRTIDENAEIVHASDGFEAGQKISETLPRLVVLDLNLPGIDGFRVCENIRKNERFAHTRILAITGYGTPEVEQRILKAGANGYLPKPFKTDEFKEKVRQVLGETSQ